MKRFLLVMRQTLGQKNNSTIAMNKLNTIFMVLVLSLSFVSFSDAIPILGPKEVNTDKKIPSQIVSPKPLQRQLFGPTTKNDTLWQIAKNVTPKNQSIYKTMGAIYRLNPSVFENNNIHVILPNSTLLMPTIAEIQRETISDVSARLAQDEKLLRQIQSVVNIKPNINNEENTQTQPTVVIDNKKEEIENNNRLPQNASVPPLIQKLPTTAVKDKVSVVDLNTDVITSLIEKQLNNTNQDISKLLENNHVLKVKMAEIQHELATVRDKLAEDEPLNKEIKQFLETQRSNNQETSKESASFIQKLADKSWLLLAIALLPALLVIGGVFLLMRLRNAPEKEALIEKGESLEQSLQTDSSVIDVKTQSKEKDDVQAAYDDNDEELDLSQEIDVSELFKSPSEKEKQSEKDEKTEPQAQNAPSEQSGNFKSYAELNEIARQAEEYAQAKQDEMSATNENDVAVVTMLKQASSNEEQDSINEQESSQKQSEQQSAEAQIVEDVPSQKEADFLKDLAFIPNEQANTDNSADLFTDEELNKAFESFTDDNEFIDSEPEEREISNQDDQSTKANTQTQMMDSLSFPNLDEINLTDLGEFEEEEAFSAALAEQKELEEFAIEKRKQKESQAQAQEDENLVAGLDMQALLDSSFDDASSTLPSTDIDENTHEDDQENLELAKAFIEMEDPEAAIPMLTELLQSTNTQVAKEAQALLEMHKKDV